MKVGSIIGSSAGKWIRILPRDSNEGIPSAQVYTDGTASWRDIVIDGDMLVQYYNVDTWQTMATIES